MKIISKYKDYYDYLKGVYGEDPKLILDRRTNINPTSYPGHDGLHVLVICGKILEYICLNNKFYFGDEIAQLNVGELKSSWYFKVKNTPPTYTVNTGVNSRNVWNFDQIYYPKLSEDVHNIYPEVKKLSEKCPIFLLHHFSKTIWMEYPKLDDLGVAKMIPAHDIWNDLSNYLSQKVSKQEPQVPVGDDKTRLISAGFDPKTSFRN